MNSLSYHYQLCSVTFIAESRGERPDQHEGSSAKTVRGCWMIYKFHTLTRQQLIYTLVFGIFGKSFPKTAFDFYFCETDNQTEKKLNWGKNLTVIHVWLTLIWRDIHGPFEFLSAEQLGGAPCPGTHKHRCHLTASMTDIKTKQNKKKL